MTKETDYLENAAETMQLAQRVSSTEDRGRLLRLAEAWLDLADRARQVSRRLRKSGPVHPLIEQTFDPHPDE
jgi:hypothetical protein